ncbi:MAG: PQQ-dependent sugar dehydrogenase [Dehalococcoidia bacterium]
MGKVGWARMFLVGMVGVLVGALLAPAGHPARAAVSLPAIDVVEVTRGFSSPTSITGAGDGSGRVFVTEQAGLVRIVKGSNLLAAPFLSISDRVRCCGERGLLSVAFPPGFAQKQYFYAYYTDSTGDLVISRFRVTANPDIADPTSEQRVLTVRHRDAGNHNGGQLQFGPDGYLYIGTGDGGGGNDPSNNGQNSSQLLGKLLRIDVETGRPVTYTVPANNPRLPGWAPEIWATGLRNPWRFSFDRLTGDLYIGDVGQSEREEIDFQPAGSAGGQNYGWRIWEGTRCNIPPSGTSTCSTDGFTFPIVEYDHNRGGSVNGGYVYRGTEFPGLQGFYIFSDLGGWIWVAVREGSAWTADRVKLLSGTNLSTNGEDDSANLYVADYGRGILYKIVQAGASSGPTATARVPTPTTPPLGNLRSFIPAASRVAAP